MGNILSAISDDIDEYEALCEHFKEKPKLHKRADGGGINPYSRHAAELKTRLRAEQDKGQPKSQPAPKQLELKLPEAPNVYGPTANYEAMRDKNQAKIDKLEAKNAVLDRLIRMKLRHCTHKYDNGKSAVEGGIYDVCAICGDSW